MPSDYRTCAACGFDNAEPDKPCPLCGESRSESQIHVLDDRLLTPLAGTDLLDRSTPRSIRFQTRQAGSLFAGRYEVESLLGRGGMGSVYRVIDREDKTILALKILHSSSSEDDAGIERFKREVQILSRLSHPAVPRIYRWGREEGELFFISELIDGADLRSLLKKRSPWSIPEATALVADVADALSFAHGLGIIHRDVKPHNIMVDHAGGVKLLDFGIARGVGLDMKTITATGMIVGTPEYMSPEQLESHRVEAQSDIYSLGVVLFEILTGRLPFSGDTPIKVAMQHLNAAPLAPRSIRHDLPVWLDRLVLKCLEKDPKMRFATASELSLELRRSRGGRGLQVERIGSGDWIMTDDSGATSWALSLSTPKEKKGWSVGMALSFREEHFKLAGVETDSSTSRIVYRFLAWPPEEILRRVIDYEVDCAERKEAVEAQVVSRLKRWISPPKS